MYKTGDVVRFKDNTHSLGLHENTDVYDKQAYQYSVTNDECLSGFYARHNQLILVCSVEDRKDI